MPIKDDCTPCDIPPSGYYQHLFLGLTIVNFNAQAGWGNQPSQVDVTLVEDGCNAPKIGYNEQLDRVIWNAADQGFYGENRYQSAADSSYYSACVKADPADSLSRSAMDVVGMPVYFRVGDTYTGGDKEFEFAGVISDWVKNESANGATTYQVKIVDPRIILQGCYMIIGDYAGAITDTLNSLCPPVNVFNVYGYGETFGVYCPSYSQCSPGTYSITSALCTSVDGPVFGTFSYGFGGSQSNENGMPVDNILLGFNLLANSIPANQNYFSPYGRVSWRAASIPGGLSGNAFGLMDPDTGAGCFASKNFYFVDISELPRTGSTYYRISGSVMSVMDLIETMSQDLGFDYYIELVPVQDGGHVLGSADVAKFIKVRVVHRYTTPTLGKICDFISNLDCVVSKSNGIELRNDASARFIVGGKKQTIYQAEQDTNPDENYTLPPWGTGANDPDELADLNSYTGSVVVTGGCNAIDDVIIPYFGLDRYGNTIVPCQDASGYWYFDAPSIEIQGSLSVISTGGSDIQIGEEELAASLVGYDEWLDYVHAAHTHTGELIESSWDTEWQAAKNMETTWAVLAEAHKRFSRDARNPRLQKYIKNDSTIGQQVVEDIQTLYQFIHKYARDYYGKKFAVRVPFSCNFPDTESGRYRHSDHPVNDGGWTEMTPVIGLPNSLANPFTGLRPMDFFRNDQNKITPFVRFNNPILKDLSNLDKDDYLFYYTIDSGDYASISTGNGVPSGNPGAGNKVYLDLDTYMIYIYNVATTTWVNVLDLCVTADNTSPPGSLNSTYFCPVYVDTDSGTVYLANQVTYAAPTYTFSSWIECEMSVFVRATVDEEYVYHDRAYAYGPRVVVSIGQSVNEITKKELQVQGLDRLFRAMAKRNAGNPATPDLDTPPKTEKLSSPQKDDEPTEEEVEQSLQNVGGNIAGAKMAPRAYVIDAAAIPIKSENLTYGPWFAEGTTAPVEVISDAGMVPWQFNGYTNMNAAGALLVAEGLAGMERGETGTITVQGMPSLPLGAELGAVGGGYYSGGSYLVENRSYSTDNYADTDPSGNAISVDYGYIPLPAWSGVYGPNITNINVSMSSAGLTTRYDLRSFTPRQTSMPKWNIERLKRVSTNLINTIQQVKRGGING